MGGPVAFEKHEEEDVFGKTWHPFVFRWPSLIIIIIINKRNYIIFPWLPNLDPTPSTPAKCLNSRRHRKIDDFCPRRGRAVIRR